MKQDLIIEKIHEGTRIDSVLSLLLEDTSRNYISKVIEQGGLKVNGKEELDRMNSVENDFFSEFRNDFMPASIQDLPENDVKIAPAREAADSRTKVAEEKVDLTKTMVITKG